MGAITRVNKSRKEWKCSRCGKEIHKGDSYLRGDLNFARPVIRCCSCGLQPWEVTTSDYQLSVGELVYRWTDNYDATEDGIGSIVDELENIKSDLEDKLDNMPEGLKDGDTGMLLQDRIENLDSAINDLQSIDTTQEDDESEEDYEERMTNEIESALGNIEV